MIEEGSQPRRLRALSDTDARHVSALLDAAGVEHPDLNFVLTEPDPDALIDRILRDEVHSPRP